MRIVVRGVVRSGFLAKDALGACGKCRKPLKITQYTCYNDFYGDLCAKCEKGLDRAGIDPWTGKPV